MPWQRQMPHPRASSSPIPLLPLLCLLLLSVGLSLPIVVNAQSQFVDVLLDSDVELSLTDDSTVQLQWSVPVPSDAAPVTAVWSLQCVQCGVAAPLSLVVTPRQVSLDVLQSAEWPLWSNASAWWTASGLLGVWLQLNVSQPTSASALEQLQPQLTFSINLTQAPPDPVPYVVQLAPPQPLAPTARPHLLPASLVPPSLAVPYYTLQCSLPVQLYPLLSTSSSDGLLYSTGLLVPLHDYTPQLSPSTASYELELQPNQLLDVTLLPDPTGFGCQLMLQGSSAMTFYNGWGGRLTLSWLDSPSLSAAAAAQGLMYQSPVLDFQGSFWPGMGIFWVWYANMAPASLDLQMDGDAATTGFWPWQYLNHTTQTWVDPSNISQLAYLQEQRQGLARTFFTIDTQLSTTWAVTGRLPLPASTADSSSSSSTGDSSSGAALSSTADSGSLPVQPCAAGQPCALSIDSAVSVQLVDASIVELQWSVPVPSDAAPVTAVWSLQCVQCGVAAPLSLVVTPRQVSLDVLQSAEWPLWSNASAWWTASGLLGVWLQLNVSQPTSASALEQLQPQLTFSINLTQAPPDPVPYVVQLAPP